VHQRFIHDQGRDALDVGAGHTTTTTVAWIDDGRRRRGRQLSAPSFFRVARGFRIFLIVPVLTLSHPPLRQLKFIIDA